MKVNNNDYSNKSNKEIKRNNLNKKCSNSKGNKTKISSPKSKQITNLKKNINNGIKAKYIFRKSFDSKFPLKQAVKTKSISSNHTIIINHQIIKHSQKTIAIPKKLKVNNKNKEHLSKKKAYNSDDNIKSLINKSFNNFLKGEKEPKLVNSLSTATGLTLYKANKKQYINYGDSEDNNHKINYNVDTQSIEKNNKFIEDNKQNINNFCYETISKEEDLNENKIVLKCDNNSLLTFGNSFSYSNSQKSKSTKKYFNNDKKNNNDKNIIIHNDNAKNSSFTLLNHCNINNNYLNKLKEENETLRKELKESNDQITFLMYQIKELKENQNHKIKRNLKNKIAPPNLWGKKIKLDFSDKENFININNDKTISSHNNKNKEKIKINKSLIKHDSMVKNGKTKQKKEIIRSNKKLNIDKKKIQSTRCNGNGKPSVKIHECISKIKI
jgi:hypothetical protein